MMDAFIIRAASPVTWSEGVKITYEKPPKIVSRGETMNVPIHNRLLLWGSFV